MSFARALALLLVSTVALAQSVPAAPILLMARGGAAPGSGAPIIDSSRVIDWTDAGVPGGVPTRSTVAYTDTGGIDSVSTLNTQLAACTGGQVVQLQAGTYTVSSTINITTACTLRGAGVGSTILDCTASATCVIMGAVPSGPSGINVIASVAKGATTISVASTTGLAVNDYVVLDQINDEAEVINTDGASGNEPCRSGSSGTRCMGQMVKITAINSLVLTVDPPIYHAFESAQTPQVWEVSSVKEGAGIEDLTLTRSNFPDQNNSNIVIIACSGCYVDGIESNTPDWWHISIDRAIWSTVQHSRFNDGQAHEGGYAYGVVSYMFATANLVVDNVFYRLRHAMLAADGAVGNVYAYNFEAESWQGTGTGETWLPGSGTHGAHPTMNLYEGNSVGKIEFDNEHGSSSYNTAFRNHVKRKSDYAGSGGITQARRALNVATYNTGMNLVGNVLGDDSQSWTISDPGATRSNSGTYSYNFGYHSDGDTSATNYSTILASTFVHGNWEYATDSQSWDSGNDNHTLPDSLIYGAKPSWFGDCAWPPFDPSDGTTNTPPAEDRYNGGDGQCTLAITTMSLTNGEVDSSYSQSVVATGGVEPYTFGNNGGGTSLNDGDAECDGLSIATSGAITGTPTTEGDCSFTADVEDADSNTDTQALTITVDAAASGEDPDEAGCRSGQNVISMGAATFASLTTAIASASNGDCVQFPASSSVSVSSSFITTSKGITIDVNGSTITRTGGTSPLFNVTANSTSPFRLTNGHFVQTTGGSGSSLVLLINGTSSDQLFRVDHSTFTGSAAPTIFFDITAWGLIDSSDFSAPNNSEMLQIKGIGSWTDTITPGGQNFVYIEDSTFTNNGSSNANSAIQAYYGARYVARYNTLNQSQFDMHGTSGQEGARYAEIYENTLNNPSGAKATDKFADLRAGSGLVYDNHCGTGVCQDIYFREEDSGTWPRAWQPGSGYNGHTNGHSTCAVSRGTLSNPSNTAPFYTWNNEPDVSTHPADTGVVVEGRDWIDFASEPASIYQMNASGDTCSTSFSYVPLAYPHPQRLQ